MSDSLESEIARLSLELEQTQQDKIKAAEYGLQVLEEKQTLQQRCEELELNYETVKHELERAREVSPFFVSLFVTVSR